MKLTIGENIRSFRKKNDLTQETLAERLGVSYQSISRWENGANYPDLEMLPAIADALAVTIDELLEMPDRRKEEQAEKAFDALHRECMKGDYDRQVIIDLIRDIRRNYMASDLIWRPFCEGNHRTVADKSCLRSTLRPCQRADYHKIILNFQKKRGILLTYRLFETTMERQHLRRIKLC